MVEPEDVDWSRLSWVGYGVVLGLLLGWIFYSFIGTLVFALFVYYAVRPFHRRIRAHVRQRTVAALLSLLVLAVPIVLLVAYTAAIALQEVGQFTATTDLGPVTDRLRPYVNVSAAVDNPQSFLEEAGGWDGVSDLLGQTLSYLGLLGATFIHTFLMFAVAFYLLRDGHRLRAFRRLLRERNPVLDTYARAVDRSLQKIFFGNILNAILTAAIGAISYSLINAALGGPLDVPYPALMGVFAGIASLIPIVGMKLVWVPLAVYLGGRAYLLGSGWEFVGVFTVVSIVVVDAIPDFALRPYVSGRSLHVGAVMIAYIVGPLLFGWYGIFLGPMVLVVVVHFVRIVLPELLAGEPLTPRAVEAASVAGGPEGDGLPAAGDPSPPEESTPTADGSSESGASDDDPSDGSREQSSEEQEENEYGDTGK